MPTAEVAWSKKFTELRVTNPVLSELSEALLPMIVLAVRMPVLTVKNELRTVLRYPAVPKPITVEPSCVAR